MGTISKHQKKTLEQWHKDPNNWSLGFFYFNKADQRLLPPKDKNGWLTVNFANTKSVLFLLNDAFLFFVTLYIALQNVLFSREG
jgi:uncharacterized membrane protein